MDKTTSLIEVSQVRKDFKVGKNQVRVLKGVDLKINDGEFVIIFGHSGCGKSTLLNTIMGLERPTEGSVKFRGKDIYQLNEDNRAKFRRRYIGMVSQQANWIKALRVAENVAYPLVIAGSNRRVAHSQAVSRLKDFKLEGFARYVPTELSGGEQQRVTICRALVTNPDILVADEPTGNLDEKTGEEVMNIFKNINQTSGLTILMVSHNSDYVKYASKVVYMSDGLVEKIVDKTKTNKNEVAA